jgi:quercetin dioxygenase-like cupin family protein
MKAIHLDKVEEREPIPGFHGRFVHGDNMTLAFWRIENGASAPTHQHPHEQVFHLLEGRFELTVENESTIYEPGAIVVIPSNLPHSARALSESRVLDIFHPVREDMR